jgi:DNA replication factor GINS
MSEDSFLQSIRDRDFAYLLSATRLKVKQNIPQLDIGSVHLNAMSQGDMIELPRWIGEVLVDLDLCESQEESFSSEVFKAVNREKIAGPDQIAKLSPDFYLKIRRHLSFWNDFVSKKPTAMQELDKTKTLIYDLIALRLRKILMIASSLSPPDDIREKLTPEEYQIFDTTYNLLQSWRTLTLEGK